MTDHGDLLIGRPTTDRYRLGAWLGDLTATGRADGDLAITSVVPALWTASLDLGLDPAGVVAQSYIETDGWQYTGDVDASQRNTAGIRVAPPMLAAYDEVNVKDGTRARQVLDALSHASFGSWLAGAIAQCQHILAYAGLAPTIHATTGRPAAFATVLVDPRYDVVRSMGLGLETWQQIATSSWASAGYTNIGGIIADIRRGTVVR